MFCVLLRLFLDQNFQKNEMNPLFLISLYPHITLSHLRIVNQNASDCYSLNNYYIFGIEINTKNLTAEY